MRKLVVLIGLVSLFSCKENQKKTNKSIENTPVEVTPVIKGNSFTTKIEEAHYKAAFLENEAVSYDLVVNFGGNTILNGTVTQLTNGSKIRIDDKKDSSKIIYDNKEAFICPSETEDPMARFHIFTWSYFFSLPYKLNDDGTIWSNTTSKKWGDSTLETAKLTFEAGTGDAPKDWYVIYKDNDSNVLKGAAYIVSFGKEVSEAEKEPHAIKYNDFITVKGVPFSTNWTFHMWTDTEGFGDQIGEVKLSNIKFLENTEELFKKPENSRILKSPN